MTDASFDYTTRILWPAETEFMVPAAGAGIEPDNIPNLWGWWKADAGTFEDNTFSTAAADDNDTVNGWQDQSGNNRHWSANLSPVGPKLKLNIVNSLPVLRPVDAATWLNTGPDASGLTAGEIFVVIKCNTDPGDESSWHRWGTSVSANHFTFSDGVIYDGWGTDIRKTVGDPAPVLTSWRLYNAISASGEYTVNLDGTQIFTTGTNTVAFSATPVIFTGNNASSFAGDIAEIIMYSAKLSSGDRDSIESYVQTRYGLTF